MDKTFPILFVNTQEKFKLVSLGCPEYVEWSKLLPHEQQAQRNHRQSLERLAQRGGLGLQEMVAVLSDKRFQYMNNYEALRRLLVLLED